MVWETLVLPLAGLLRGLLGWAENALKDGEVTKPELYELLTTIVRVTTWGMAAYFGLNLDIAQAAGAGVLADLGAFAIKKGFKK